MDEKERKELMTIQPNNVTFGQYEVSSIQENILTAISDFLQPRMTNNKGVVNDLMTTSDSMKDMEITINCNEVGGKNNKKRVTKEAKDLMSKQFSFRWVVPGTTQNVETTGVVVTTVHDLKGTSVLKLSVNKWAIPYLIYYGKGVGGTLFSKQIALNLRGKYAKRIYKIICSQRDRSVFEYSIKQFCADFEVPKNYDNAHIKSKILEPARKSIAESHSDVNFDYEFITKKRSKSATKPVADTIVFNITPRSIPLPLPQDKIEELRKESQRDYTYAYAWMKRISGDDNDLAVMRAVDNLQASGHIGKFVEKCKYYDDQVNLGKCQMIYARNVLAKILREDYKITIVVHKY